MKKIIEPVSHLWRRANAFLKHHERRATTLAFVAGFVVDALTLRRVDLWLENVAFLTYLTNSGLGIVLYHAYEGGKLQGRRGSRHIRWIPIAIQFSFGALLSGFFVFYSRSASLVRSWPFLLLLLVVIVGNERLRGWHARLPFQVSVFFLIVFSYAIFLVPVVLRTMGAHTFLLSGFLGILITWLLMRGLKRLAALRHRESVRRVVRSVALIATSFTLLYFFNIIPPIPLSLQDIGVYHSISRLPSGDYRVTYESVRWYELTKRFTPVFHREKGEPVQVLSAVFAPTRLTLPILHRWAYYDETKNEWISSTSVRFTIVGARNGGYRGYSTKTSVPSGKWRVDVLTERGQLIGRITFRVVEGAREEPLKEGVR